MRNHHNRPPNNRYLLPPSHKLAKRNTEISVHSLIKAAGRNKTRRTFIPICTFFATLALSVISASVWFQPDLPYIDLPASSITTVSQSSSDFSELFAETRSPGTLALCAAEGNCIVSINEKTHKLRIKFSDEYYGHVDPGNGVYNRGFCSDQGRGGVKETLEKTIRSADEGCLRRTKSRIDRAIAKMKEAGLDSAHNQPVFIHFLDLWNQASPRVSDNFPKAYQKAIAQNKTGDDALLWGRVEAFRRNNGQLEAGRTYPANKRVGLFKVCVEQPYFRNKLSSLEIDSEKWRWNCIALDQGRRTRAISDTLSTITKLKSMEVK